MAWFKKNKLSTDTYVTCAGCGRKLLPDFNMNEPSPGYAPEKIHKTVDRNLTRKRPPMLIGAAIPVNFAFVPCPLLVLRRARMACTLASLLASIGCVQHKSPARATPPECATATWKLHDSTSQGPVDAKYRCVAMMVPGFGGIYRNEEGGVTIVLRDTSQLRSVLEALYVAGLGMYDARHAHAVLGKYSYLQLSDWQMALTRVIFQISGVTNIGQQLMQNRLSIGVASEEAKAAVRERLTQLRIPEDAVIFGRAMYGRPAGH